MLTTTPSELTEDVLDFCKEVETSTPFFVEVKPADFARPNFCFQNVETQIENFSGKKCYGWEIWYKKGMIIEAEFHCIWQSPEGRFLDITPQMDGERKILFLPSHKIYKNKRIDNIRKNLSDSPIIDLYIECAKKTVSKFTTNKIILNKELGWWSGFLLNMFMHNLKSNSSLCLCGSGREFRKCCKKRILDFLKKIN